MNPGKANEPKVYHSPLHGVTGAPLVPTLYMGTVHVQLFGDTGPLQLLGRLDGGVDAAVELGFGVDEEGSTCCSRREKRGVSVLVFGR